MNNILTGYPSKDRPWMKFYTEGALKVPTCTVFQRIYENNKIELENIALEYFGSKITYKKLFEDVSVAAAAFVNYGVKKNDRVIIFSSSTPEIRDKCIFAGKELLLQYFARMGNVRVRRDCLHQYKRT